MTATPAEIKAHAAISMAVSPQPEGKGFIARSSCGRSWFVPLEKIREDYAKFLHENDGLTMEEAYAKVDVNDEFLPTWFHEQFIWEEVEVYGTLLTQPSPARLKEILDFYRNNFSGGPGDDSTGVGIPD